MAKSEIHQDDIGTVLEMTVKDGANVVNLSTSTTLAMKFTRPDGTSFTETAVYSTDGSDGKMRYVTQSGDLNQSGDWQWQGVITFATESWHTDVLSFYVNPNLAGS